MSKKGENGLVGSWTFDELYPIDHSGYSNHIIGKFIAGPPAVGMSLILIPHYYFQVTDPVP